MVKLRQDRGAQVAMVDAILFMTIMLVASAIIIGSSGSDGTDAQEYLGLQQYTGDFAGTFLSVEFGEMTYLNGTGGIVIVGNGKSVGLALCDEALLLQRSGGVGDFTSYDKSILDAGRNLLRPGLDFAVSCDIGSIFISTVIENSTQLPLNHCASQVQILAGENTAITITVFVWVV